jgi:hypothetical protein
VLRDRIDDDKAGVVLNEQVMVVISERPLEVHEDNKH